MNGCWIACPPPTGRGTRGVGGGGGGGGGGGDRSEMRGVRGEEWRWTLGEKLQFARGYMYSFIY